VTRAIRFVSALLLAAAAVPAAAQPEFPSPAGGGAAVKTTALPTPLKSVGFDQRLGARVPLDLPFVDDAGRPVRLGDYFGKRPVVFALAYFSCPMLCNLVMSDMAAALKVLAFDAGRDYDVVVVSFDPHDTPGLAKAKKQEMVERSGHPGTAAGWHFLTGREASIAALTQAVGFRYYWDAETRNYAHTAAILVMTPKGRVARYFYGLEYPPRDLRLALVESSGETLGSPMDQIILYCFHYDPVIGKYSATTMNIVRLGGVLTVAGLALLVVLLRRREQPGQPEQPGHPEPGRA
jgi:protein SCO1/2